MNCWLLKSEPDVFSLDDLARRPGGSSPWDGVRNYQARNFMRDEMKVGDLGLFYHSSCPEPGVAGIVEVTGSARPDDSSWDPDSEYFDPKSSPENPRWYAVEVTWRARFPRFVTLGALRDDAALRDLQILRRGNRLSITPVTGAEFARICRLGDLSPIPRPTSRAQAGKRAGKTKAP